MFGIFAFLSISLPDTQKQIAYMRFCIQKQKIKSYCHVFKFSISPIAAKKEK